MSFVAAKFRRSFQPLTIIVLSVALLQGISSAVWGATLTPPENMAVYLKLPVIVQSVTGLPFTFFPSLGGADRTKFIADDLINRDELLHTITYLKGQLFIRIVTSPDTVNELQATINACEFLLRHFNRIATQVDAQGNRAIGVGDIERLFAPTPERGRDTSSMY